MIQEPTKPNLQRVSLLKSFLEKDPSDSFSRYALALEYANAGDTASATPLFEELLQKDPDYTATYYHFGKLLERVGKHDTAKAIYESGISVTMKKGDMHALKELREAYALLTGGADDED